MRINCILSLYALFLFWGLIFLFFPFSILIYLLMYFFVKYPQDTFQELSALIYRIFFKLVPRIHLKLDLLDNTPKSAIYVSSHQSSLDYPILGSFIPKYLSLTNINVKMIPIANIGSRLIGIRYLNKNNLSMVEKTYKEFENVLLDNRNIMLFPEGTRHTGAKLGKFKKIAFRLAMNTNRPIIPIVIEGSSRVLPKGSPCYATLDDTTIYVKMLEPIYPEKFSSEKELLEYTQNIIQNQKDILCNTY
ncbi:MAG: 1-acyl-sn-glycerol-3-phosphate acyltransferase [Sulfurimonas sp.]|nr:1-acyl-sn-glycerol-3-phosphate acyltransferase [Sulfurimonas sp.]